MFSKKFDFNNSWKIRPVGVGVKLSVDLKTWNPCLFWMNSQYPASLSIREMISDVFLPWKLRRLKISLIIGELSVVETFKLLVVALKNRFESFSWAEAHRHIISPEWFSQTPSYGQGFGSQRSFLTHFPFSNLKFFRQIQTWFSKYPPLPHFSVEVKSKKGSKYKKLLFVKFAIF